MPHRARAVVVSLVVAALTSPTRLAAADKVKQECAQSADTGQRLRDEGKPLAARIHFLSCARDVCPTLIRDHCTRWLDELDASIPSIVIKAHEGSGARAVDVTDVTVSIDGVKVADALDGQAMNLEPGGHTVRYVRAGAAPVETHVLLVAGEKNRVLTVEFPGAAPPPPPPAATRPKDAPADEGETSIRPAAWVFAGVAVVAGASFGYFGATGKSQLDSLRASCAGHCAQSDVSSAWDTLIVADISLAVGVVSVGVAAWLFLTPRRSDATPKDASGLLVGPGPNGIRIGWQGAF